MVNPGHVIAQAADGGWLCFREPVRVLRAQSIPEVRPVLAQADQALEQGFALAGFVAYEAAGGMDSALETREPAEIPLVWLGVYAPPMHISALPPAKGDPHFSFSAWACDTDLITYRQAFQRIKEYIYAGDTYQVNYTVRLHSRFDGDAFACFRQLVKAQRCQHAVYIDTGELAICSASPELFFARDGERIFSRPMKGTCERGLTTQADQHMAAALAGSEKNRAENVMIVDMIRNDLGRIAFSGSVEVPCLFEIERYPTLFQMVSTVEARTQASFSKALRALFPCASITGAPKVRTMQIIRELETSPRGVYTGMAGYQLPDGTAHFNVAIRTVTINRTTQHATYGTGGGIVWDSCDKMEYAECLTKARILNTCPEPFSILETLLYTLAEGFFLLESHIKRAKDTAAFFDYPFDEDRMRDALSGSIKEFSGDAPLKVRWLLAEDGQMHVEAAEIKHESTDSWTIGVAEHGCSSDCVFLYHKTTCRGVYDRALSAFRECRDVILTNERGLLTESCFGNVVVELNGRKVTPPVSCGLLNGTFRQQLVETGVVVEQRVSVEELRRAARIWIVNSVRKWMQILPDQLCFEPDS